MGNKKKREGLTTKNHPDVTCRVVLRKEDGKVPEYCTRTARYIYEIEDEKKVVARTLLCSPCMRRLEDGRSLVVRKNNGDLMFIRTEVLQ